jgi:hypothetical protein
LYSSITLSSIGVKWKCVENIVKCVDKLELSSNGVKAGAIITSVITTVLSIAYLLSMISNKKRGHGYCMGGALHTAALLVLYGVMINTISTKTDPWSTDGLKFLFSSSFYLAFILSGVHMIWFIIFLHISSNEDGVGVCFTEP